MPLATIHALSTGKRSQFYILNCQFYQTGLSVSYISKVCFPNFITDTMNWCLNSKLDYNRHCVIYGEESWSGVLEWSHRVESWSGFWSGMKSNLELLLHF